MENIDLKSLQELTKCINNAIPIGLKITKPHPEDIEDFDFVVFFGDKSGHEQASYYNCKLAENWGYLTKSPIGGFWYFSHKILYPEINDNQEHVGFIDIVNFNGNADRWFSVYDCILGMIQFKLSQDFKIAMEEYHSLQIN
jgi:hypothetical protein